MPWCAWATPLACFTAVINGTRCIIRKRQTAPLPFRAAVMLTENQCLVSHEHPISWTLVQRGNTGRTSLSAGSIRCIQTSATFGPDKASDGKHLASTTFPIHDSLLRSAENHDEKRFPYICEHAESDFCWAAASHTEAKTQLVSRWNFSMFSKKKEGGRAKII